MNQQRELEELNAIVNSPGWEVFMRYLEQTVSGCTVENLTSAEELWEARGSLATVAFVKNFPQYLEQAFDVV